MNVSLIIPVYNTEKYLRRCLDSVLAQTFRDFECILVDDGSTDGSAAILDEYASNLKPETCNLKPSFRVFHEKNRGSSLARLFGIQQARGEWLVFMDSDDDVHPEYIQRLYEAAQESGMNIAACPIKGLEFENAPKAVNPNAIQIIAKDELQQRFMRYEFWGFWGKIFSKNVFDGLYFPTYSINEDYVVMAQVFQRVPSIAYFDKALYFYRPNPFSQSKLRLTSHIMDEYYNKEWVVEFYEQHNPKYVHQTKMLLVDSCIKICHIIRSDDQTGKYKMELSKTKGYIQKNIFSILISKYLVWGLKVQALKIALFY